MKNKEKKFTWILLGVAILGLFIFVSNIYTETRNELKNIGIEEFLQPLMTGKEAVSIANDFLKVNNIIDPDEYSHAVSFTNDSAGISFLKRSLSAEEVQQYYRDNKLGLLNYGVRFFQQLEKKEFAVIISARDEKVIGFSSKLAEDEERTSLDKDPAREKVLSFLMERHDVNRLEEIDYSSEKLENRTDHYFSFRVQGSEIESEFGQGYLEVHAVVKGDSVSSYGYNIFVPEKFSRSVTKQFSNGILMAVLSFLASAFLFIAVLVVLIRKFIKKQTNWKSFLILSSIIAVFLLLNSVNSISLVRSEYYTGISFGVFYGIAIGLELIVILFSVLGIFIITTTGEALGREVFPKKIKILSLIIKKKFFSPEIKKTVFRAYLITFVLLGVETLILLGGEKYLDVWTIPDLAEMDLLLGFLPALSVFVIILMAAISEEFLYRLFGISFFKKYTKSTLISVIIVTVIWAVAHSTYPVFPFYFRAIELIIVGGLWAYFFIKYDIMTMVVTHYLYNGILLFLLFGSTMRIDLIISSLIIILLPLMATFLSSKKVKKLLKTLIKDFKLNRETRVKKRKKDK
ncbi:CPBP family intramembrane metalloprotease [bacterium]|nr:CPBP family intramembrane metalloprotease [bacterium]